MTRVKPLAPVAAIAFGLCTLAPAAWAGDCSAQKGKTIFEDSFKDDSGGFEQSDQAKFGAPGLRITLGKTDQDFVYVNQTFSATDGDYCAVATMPAAVSDDNLPAIGITLLYLDDQHMVALQVFSDNTVQIERWDKGDSDIVLTEQNPAIKADVGTPVSIRAVIKDGNITPYINGIAVKSIRVQVPDGANRFGVYAALDKIANKETPVDFKSLRVTTLADSK